MADEPFYQINSEHASILMVRRYFQKRLERVACERLTSQQFDELVAVLESMPQRNNLQRTDRCQTEPIPTTRTRR